MKVEELTESNVVDFQRRRAEKAIDEVGNALGRQKQIDQQAHGELRQIEHGVEQQLAKLRTPGFDNYAQMLDWIMDDLDMGRSVRHLPRHQLQKLKSFATFAPRIVSKLAEILSERPYLSFAEKWEKKYKNKEILAPVDAVQYARSRYTDLKDDYRMIHRVLHAIERHDIMNESERTRRIHR